MRKGYYSLLIALLISASLGTQAQVFEYDLADSIYSTDVVPKGAYMDGSGTPVLQFTGAAGHAPGWNQYYVEAELDALEDFRNGLITAEDLFIQNSIQLTSAVIETRHLFRARLNFSNTAGMLITQANNSTSRNYIFATDVTGLFPGSGQTTLDDLNFIDSTGQIRGHINFQDKIIISSVDPNTAEVGLYVYDSTFTHTTFIVINTTATSLASLLTNSGDSVVYFKGNNGTDSLELWRTDGTMAGTSMIKDINSGSAGSDPLFFTIHGGKLYFSANDGNGRELWVSDGTTAGTVKVKDLNSTGGSDPFALTPGPGGLLYFAATDDSGNPLLYKTDGTSAGTAVVSTTIQVGASNATVRAFNGAIYFAGYPTGGTAVNALYKTDGTSGGTQKVYDVYTGSAAGYGVFLSIGMEAADGYLYFTGNDSIHGYEPYRTDGTTAGTGMVGDISDDNTKYPNYFTALPGGGVFFRHFRSDIGTELFIADQGTGVGIADFKEPNQFILYPNPATCNITVKTNSPDGIYKVNLMNITGQVIHSSAVVVGGGELKYTRPESATAGMYFLQIQGADRNISTLKVVYR